MIGLNEETPKGLRAETKTDLNVESTGNKVHPIRTPTNGNIPPAESSLRAETETVYEQQTQPSVGVRDDNIGHPITTPTNGTIPPAKSSLCAETEIVHEQQNQPSGSVRDETQHVGHNTSILSSSATTSTGNQSNTTTCSLPAETHYPRPL